MNYQAIHQALKNEELNWRMAAEAIGCSAHHLMNVSSRRVGSRPVAIALAALINSDVASVFPDVPRYQVDSKGLRAQRLQRAKAQLAETGLRTA